MLAKQPQKLYDRIREILESARAGVARSVNTAQVVANWLIGRELVEEEQKGSKRADYGKKLIATLSAQITAEFGKGYSVNNLEHFRVFYLTYPELLSRSISHALRGKSFLPDVLSSADKESWTPGRLNPNLSWTHYRTLLRVDKGEARAFYEIEALKNNWSARELERQINSLLYRPARAEQRQERIDATGDEGAGDPTACGCLQRPGCDRVPRFT